jgi:anti-sigma factor RsiW
MSQCTCHSELELYHDGELDDGRSEALRQHVAGCGECSRDLRELDDLSGFFRVEPIAEMNDQELARLHVEVDRIIGERQSRTLAFPWVRAISAAAASFVIIAAAWMAQTQRTQVADVRPRPVEPWVGLAFGDPLTPGFEQPRLADARMASWFLENLHDGGQHAKND